MQETRDFRRKLVASLIIFMIVFSNFATLASGLVSLAADASDEKITYQAQFVMITNSPEDQSSEEEVEEEPVAVTDNFADEVVGQEIEEPITSLNSIDDMDDGEEQAEEVELDEVVETEEELAEEVVEEEPVEPEETQEEQPEEIQEEQPEEREEEVLQDGLAIEITLGVKTNGYLKNAKVDIKDLANQIFKLRDTTYLGEYVQSIDENKLKLKQINGGTEVKVYIPIELKDEDSVDINRLQNGVELSLIGTYVDEEGNESIITKSVKPVLNISNDMDLVVNSDVEKFIPYVKDGRNEALVQLRVTLGTNTDNQLPVKDSSIEVQLPEIEGADIKDVTISALATGFTNGLLNGDVIFTAENCSYQDGKVTININNTAKDGRYQMNVGNDEYIISYKYENISTDEDDIVINSTVNAKATVFTSDADKEISSSIEKEYNLSQASSNIVTYDVTRKTSEISKGYLYANANAEEPAYEVEYENAFDINVSRVDLVKTIQISEGTEYFVDGENNGYATSTENGENTYYKKVRLNKNNLDAIIGDEGDFEILLENGTSLIRITNETPDDGDGYITISFGENKIGKILMRINNPSGEGILNVVTTKIIADVTYEKIDFASFKSIQENFVGLAELDEGIVTEIGEKTVATELVETKTNAVVALNRNDLSTLVENKDVEINISLNNANNESDMYKNPVFELVFPSEIEDVEITDINLLYGNDELDIANIETLRDGENRVVVRITLEGIQSKYTMGDSDNGTTIILKTNMSVNMYSASKAEALTMNYYNEDATNYENKTDWQMISEMTSYMLSVDQGLSEAALNIVAPEGLVNAQMISNYKDDATIISVNQGRKEDSIATFADSKTAEMKLIVINNTDEELRDVSILGRTIFSGNKSIISVEELGTNQTAPMTSNISVENSNHKQTIYYSENGEATADLEDAENGWTTEIDNYEYVKSFLIVIDGTVQVGDILSYKYNFEIPSDLNNNLDLAGTFGTYYVGTKTRGTVEADKVVLTTGDAPVLKVETTSDSDEASVVEGQRIKYTVKVTNEGRTVSTNTVVNSLIPAGTTYVQDGELNPNVTELRIDMGDIKPGRSEEITYEVEVNRSAETQTYIETANTVEADGLETPIYTEVPDAAVEIAELSIGLNQISQGRVVKQGTELWYDVNIVNFSNTYYDNCTVEMSLPDGLEYIDGYVVGFESDGLKEKSDGQASFDSSSKKITWYIDELRNSKSLKLKAITTDINETQKELVATATISSPNLKRSYTSNEVKHTLARPVIEYDYKSTNNNQFIREGDTIEYVLNIKNTGLAEAENIKIQNSVPNNFRVVGANVIKNGVANNALIGKDISFNVTLNSNEEAQIVLECVVNNLDDVNDDVVTSNNWVISGKDVDTVRTNSVQNIVQQNYELTNNSNTKNVENSVVREENNVTSQDNISALTINQTEDTSGENTNAYKIIGVAFSDLNNNGERDDNEEGMKNIVVKLCDASSQKIVAQTVTNDIGEYVFGNVIAGEYYIKFEYDTTKYTLSEYQKQGVASDKNSDAIISNYKAVTDKIDIKDTGVSDIDIGLVRAGIFDLDLDANINRMTVQNDEETINYEMENPKLAKVDINPKYINSSKVYVEYTIDVTNKGEIAGYVKRIVDYLPTELELDTSLNPGWYIGADGYAYNEELANTLIEPGETKTIRLVLTKQMNENSTGLINNTFEIAKTYNEYAISDIDSVENNQADGEDDMSRADVLIGVQTGGNVINVMIISTTLITLLIALYVIKIQVDKRNKEVIV